MAESNHSMDPAANFSCRLLGCLTRSPHAGAIVSESAALAKILEAELMFAHVGESTPAVRAELEDTIHAAESRPGSSRLIIQDGRPATVICDIARREEVDLIVAGALEREGLLDTLMMGSIARRIARKSPCSVLLLARGQSPARDGFQTVVAATLNDERSRGMLQDISRQMRRSGTKRLHVVQELDDYERRGLRIEGLSFREIQENERRWMLERQEALADLMEDVDFGDVELHTACLKSAAGVAAMEYAERFNADLLVYPAPSRRLTYWDRFFNNPGCVVLQRIQCALLFHRPPRRRAGGREAA